MLKINCLKLLEGRKQLQAREKHLLYQIIYFSVQFSAILNMFIVKIYLNSIFTNDLERKDCFSKNVPSYRPSLFKKYKSKHMIITKLYDQESQYS